MTSGPEPDSHCLHPYPLTPRPEAVPACRGSAKYKFTGSSSADVSQDNKTRTYGEQPDTPL